MIDLRLGDCLEVMKTIGDKSIDAIITDPPYGTTACKWDSVIPFDLMWEQLNRIIKPNGAIVLFGSEPFSSLLRMSNIKNFKYDWIWNKPKATNFLNAKKQPLRCIENISVFYKKQCTYNPQGLIDGVFKNGRKSRESDSTKANVYGQQKNHTNSNKGNYPTQVLNFKTVHKPIHDTQKPIELMEYLIKTYTNEGETVLDFTMGSGTTGVACKNTKRNLIGIEQDENYFNIAKERINSTLL
jgi:site-specific DNA-methyltransferase (adenine-specific)